nr:MAG TPA: hypothetical protein [Caudoviricetes sp.]
MTQLRQSRQQEHVEEDTANIQPIENLQQIIATYRNANRRRQDKEVHRRANSLDHGLSVKRCQRVNKHLVKDVQQRLAHLMMIEHLQRNNNKRKLLCCLKLRDNRSSQKALTRGKQALDKSSLHRHAQINNALNRLSALDNNRARCQSHSQQRRQSLSSLHSLAHSLISAQGSQLANKFATTLSDSVKVLRQLIKLILSQLGQSLQHIARQCTARQLLNHLCNRCRSIQRIQRLSKVTGNRTNLRKVRDLFQTKILQLALKPINELISRGLEVGNLLQRVRLMNSGIDIRLEGIQDFLAGFSFIHQGRNSLFHFTASIVTQVQQCARSLGECVCHFVWNNAGRLEAVHEVGGVEFAVVIAVNVLVFHYFSSLVSSLNARRMLMRAAPIGWAEEPMPVTKSVSFLRSASGRASNLLTSSGKPSPGVIPSNSFLA